MQTRQSVTAGETALIKMKKTIIPNPVPKMGDQVAYVSGEGPHKIHPARVLAVHPNHDGRLLNLEVTTPQGSQVLNKISWDEIGDDIPLHGNSWHWPASDKKEDPKKEDPKK